MGPLRLGLGLAVGAFAIAQANAATMKAIADESKSPVGGNAHLD
jgi:hypothetical protein